MKRTTFSILCYILFVTVNYSQVVISEKAIIHIDNKNTNLPEIQLFQPVLFADRTNIFDEEAIKVFGKLTNAKRKERVLINNNQVVISADSMFFADLVLSPGFNTIKIDVLAGESVERSYTYDIYRKVAQKNLTAPAIISYGKFYGLIIGVNDYKDPEINSLENPIRDATSVYNVLTTKYTFDKENVMILNNPTRKEIFSALDKLKVRITENDNLLIFYAGHGQFDQDAKIGYWLPSDATKESTADWFANSNLTDQLKRIPAKHTLVISDACFSGSIFASRSAFGDASKAIEKAYALKSRQAITSGSLYEVPDNSVFIYYLLDRLKSNREKYITAEQLYINIKSAVANNGPSEAKFGDIQGVGHEGGDFVFILREN